MSRVFEATTAKREVVLPPHSIEAETALLGSIMLGQADTLARAQTHVRMSDFYRHAHGDIFRAMCKVVARAEPIDIVTVKDELARVGKLEACGGLLYLQQIAEFVPTPANVDHYAKIVKEKSLRREAIERGKELVRKAYEGTLEEVTEDAQRIALRLLSDDRQGNVLTASEAMSEAVARMANPIPGVPSGIPMLDWMLGSLVPGTLTVISADPGMGKTQLSLQYALNAAEMAKAEGKGEIVVFITVEMPSSSLAQRLAFRIARIDSQEVKRSGGKLNGKAEFLAYKEAATHLSALPLYFRDQRTSSVDAGAIPALVKQLHMEHWRASTGTGGVKLLVVDYLQAIKPSEEDAGKNLNEERRVSQISTMFRDLAVSLDIPVLCVSSTSRNGELRSSGQINYDAHNILHISNIETEREAEDTAPWGVMMEIKKQRDGVMGVKVKASFVKQYGFFTDFDDEEWGVVKGGKF